MHDFLMGDIPLIEETIENKIANIKKQRKYLLLESDWTQLDDVPQSIKNVWVPYRQALRDITLQSDFPTNIIWPTPPV